MGIILVSEWIPEGKNTPSRNLEGGGDFLKGREYSNSGVEIWEGNPNLRSCTTFNWNRVPGTSIRRQWALCCLARSVYFSVWKSLKSLKHHPGKIVISVTFNYQSVLTPPEAWESWQLRGTVTLVDSRPSVVVRKNVHSSQNALGITLGKLEL